MRGRDLWRSVCVCVCFGAGEDTCGGRRRALLWTSCDVAAWRRAGGLRRTLARRIICRPLGTLCERYLRMRSISAAYLPACRARGLPCMFAGLRRSYAQALVWACARLLSPRQACSPTHSIGIGSAQSLPSTAKPYSVGPIATHARGPPTRRSQRQRARRSGMHTHIANGQHGFSAYRRRYDPCAGRCKVRVGWHALNTAPAA